MDGLLKEITNLKPVMRDSTSLSRYATTILGFVNNIEQISCAVTNANKAPFVMSHISKLDAKDNIKFSCEMHCIEKEENVLNLLDWLNSEASLRSFVRKDVDYHDNSGERQIPQKFDNRAINIVMSDDDVCPLGCEAKHLAACLKKQTDQRATNAQEDIITLFIMSSLFQLIPVGIIQPHHIQTRKVPETTACRE